MAKRQSINVRLFVKQVKRNLVCSHKTKTHLTDELCTELIEQFGDTAATIPDDYAAPEEVAHDLQKDIDPNELLQIKCRRKRCIVSFAVLAFVLLAFMITYIVILASDHEVVVTERYYDYTCSSSNSAQEE